MLSKSVLIGLAIVGCLVAVFLYAATTGQIRLAGLFQKETVCGIESCHGLDIVCGQNVPEACTTEYRIGDRCRQYARCETTEGKCGAIETPEFTDCKACAEKCERDYTDNPAQMFECESACGLPE